MEMIQENRLRIFKSILEEYNYSLPLHRFLLTFFGRNKNMGSRDRRLFRQLIYSYFRLGKALMDLPIEERLFIALFLSEKKSDPFLEHFHPELNAQIDLPPETKMTEIKKMYPAFHWKEIFPFTEELSEGMDAQAFAYSFFEQPKLFLRLQSTFLKKGISILENKQISFELIEAYPNCIALPNASSLENIFSADELLNIEVQDFSSQRTGDLFKPHAGEYWWDCCAASGGKSLLLAAQEPSVRLFCSDVRDSLLENLHIRFQAAGIKNFQRRKIDLLEPIHSLEENTFDGIILDAPCSGSGTWGRSPEMITDFDKAKIKNFQSLQLRIAEKVFPFLKPGKPLIYITCSVFKEENESLIAKILQKIPLVLDEQRLIKGYQEGADTMFVARLLKK